MFHKSSVVWALFEWIAREVAKIARENKRELITSVDVQQAVRHLIGGELCRHACNEGRKAVLKYKDSFEKEGGEEKEEEEK